MDKRTVKLVIIVAMLLVVALYFVSGTYARYIDEFEGTAEVEVAKWSVKLTNGGEAVEEEINLTLTTEENENVVNNKIAPSVTASGNLELDLTGTEVAVDVIAGIEQDDLNDVFGGATAKVKIEIDNQEYKGGLEGEGTKIDLVNKSAFNEENGKKNVKVSITWENDDIHNTTDTAKGESAEKISVPLTIKVQQHIDKVP